MSEPMELVNGTMARIGLTADKLQGLSAEYMRQFILRAWVGIAVSLAVLSGCAVVWLYVAVKHERGDDLTPEEGIPLLIAGFIALFTVVAMILCVGNLIAPWPCAVEALLGR